MEIVNQTDFDFLYHQALDRDNKGKFAFLVEESEHFRLNKEFKRSLPIMENEQTSILYSVWTFRNHFLLNHVDDFISNSLSGGIPQYLDQFGEWYLHRPIDENIQNPNRVLSMSDLEHGFVLWLPWCFLAILIFFLECLYVALRRWTINLSSKMFGLFNFLTALRVNLANYHDRW